MLLLSTDVLKHGVLLLTNTPPYPERQGPQVCVTDEHGCRFKLVHSPGGICEQSLEFKVLVAAAATLLTAEGSLFVSALSRAPITEAAISTFDPVWGVTVRMKGSDEVEEL